MVAQTKIGTISVIARCGDCGNRWENYHTAEGLARQHAIMTGHTVKVERVQSFTFNPKRMWRRDE